MAKQLEPPPPRITAQRALDLLNDPAFIEDLEAAFVAVRVSSAGHQAPEHLTPAQFYDRYGVLPVGSGTNSLFRLQKPSAPHREAVAILGGRWGLLRVFPWTTDAEIRAAGKRLRQALQQSGAKEHRDQERVKIDRAMWLRQCGYSSVEIAKAVWGRRSGLRRPKLAKAVAADKDGTREAALMRRYRERGLSYQLAERLATKRLRGSEAKAAAMVRRAIRREEQRLTAARAAMAAPAALEPIAEALTALLKKLHPLDGSLAGLGRLPEIDALRRAALGLPKA
jgi:hypothetical protein